MKLTREQAAGPTRPWSTGHLFELIGCSVLVVLVGLLVLMRLVFGPRS